MNLQETLDQLGISTDNIVNLLREKKIKGVPFRACKCPVAEYLRACGFADPSVGFRTADVSDEEFPVELSPHLTAWIHAFDRGEYPEFDNNRNP